MAEVDSGSEGRFLPFLEEEGMEETTKTSVSG